MPDQQLSDIQHKLQKALTESAKATGELEKGRAAFASLEESAAQKQAEVNRLISIFQKMTDSYNESTPWLHRATEALQHLARIENCGGWQACVHTSQERRKE